MAINYIFVDRYLYAYFTMRMRKMPIVYFSLQIYLSIIGGYCKHCYKRNQHQILILLIYYVDVYSFNFVGLVSQISVGNEVVFVTLIVKIVINLMIKHVKHLSVVVIEHYFPVDVYKKVLSVVVIIYHTSVVDDDCHEDSLLLDTKVWIKKAIAHFKGREITPIIRFYNRTVDYNGSGALIVILTKQGDLLRYRAIMLFLEVFWEIDKLVD